MTGNIRSVIYFLLLLIGMAAQAQRQLLLMNGDEVAYRFKPGETFRSKWKGDKTEHWGFVVEAKEFSVITSQDTIELNKIRKLLLPGEPGVHGFGILLLKIGIGLFVMDQFNYTVIQGNKPNLDSDIAKISIGVASLGLPMLLFKKNWRKISRKTKLISVARGSRFYLSE